MADILAVTAAAILVGLAVAVATLVYLWTSNARDDLRRAERTVDKHRFDIVSSQLDSVMARLDCIMRCVSTEE